MRHWSVRSTWSGILAALMIAALTVGPISVNTAQAQAKGVEPPYFAIKGAKIITVSGGVIENGTVVMANGLITAVGKDAQIPPEAWVIDGKGFTVYPGLIDAFTDVGLPAAPPSPPAAGGPPGAAPQQAAQQRPSMGPEDRPATTPWRVAADELQPNERRIEQWRNAGFTTVLSAPKTGIFPGQGAVIDLAGERAGDMVVKTPATLHITLQQPGGFFGFPGSLFGVIAYIKQIFLDAAQARQADEIYNAGPKGLERPAYDRATQVLNAALRANRPVFFPATTKVQIVRALELNEQLKTNLVLYHVQQGYEAADIIAAKKVPVLVSLKWPEKDKDADPDAEETLRTLRFREKAPSTPAALEKAGVKFAFYSDGITNPKDILKNARKSIDAGLKADAALRAFTLSAAQILGVADRLGSIEVGKIANLVMADGDIFSEKTKVKYVFVDGRKFEVREQAPPPGPPGAGGGPTANLTGKWTLTVVTPEGTEPASADLTQAPDGSITGTVTSPYGTATISKGSVTGNRFSFTFPLDVGQGMQDVTMSGTVEGNSIKGTGSVGDISFEFSGTRPGNALRVTEEVGR